jgi:hypothetical protein
MTVTQDTSQAGEFETPFAESLPLTEDRPAALGFLPWTEAESPFNRMLEGELEEESESAELIAEAFEALRDESFDEALAELIAETSQAADQRSQGEQPMQLADQRFRLADAHLQPVGFEAERCVQRFADQLENLDLEGLAPAQLDELLDRFDPGPSTVSPAGEEFIGGLIKKAKSVVKSVVKAAGKVAKAALPILGPILNKLKALIRPLLRRVLGIAINKLPAALHEPARALAKKFGLGATEETEFELELEAEEEELTEGFAGSPVATLDPETLAESFDAALAESVLGGGELEQGETFGHDRERGGEPEAGNQLEALAEARSVFMAQLQAAADHEDLGPAVDQFIPAILPALRLGLRLVGRPKVVNFLAGFLAKLIGRWVGPTMSRPLSQAIVDVGLRIVGLEQGQPGEFEAEAAPAALAATVEDTVRRLSEQPEHVFEDEGLLEVAVAEAFEQAVAANFPAPLVRPDLRLAPSLGGTFVTRHAKQPWAYKKLSRVPEVELSPAQASAMRTFGGVTIDAAVRANGLTLPARFRVHVFEAGPGTTLPRLAVLERIQGPSGQRGAYRLLHPLTVANATALLREPKLGVDVPARFLESRHKISVGQRFFHLEPVGQTGVAVPIPTREGASCDASQPSEARIQVVRGGGRVTLFFSEVDAQKLAASITSAPGGTALLRAVLAAMRSAKVSMLATEDSAAVAPQELELELELELESERAGGRRRSSRGRPARRRPPSRRARLGRRIRARAARALSAWARIRSAEFVKAAQDPACGVTVTVQIGRPTGAAPAAETVGARVSDAGATVTVTPGRGNP